MLKISKSGCCGSMYIYIYNRPPSLWAPVGANKSMCAIKESTSWWESMPVMIMMDFDTSNLTYYMDISCVSSNIVIIKKCPFKNG